MSEESIDQSIGELVQLLAQRCPVLAPAVFPSQYCPRDLQDLCSTQEQREKVLKWAAKKGASTSSTSIRFVTDVRQDTDGIVAIKGIHIAKNEIEALLGNLEGVMNMLAQSSTKEVGITQAAFTAANSAATDADDEAIQHRSFVEAYNVAYAIKVLLSNMPTALKLQLPVSTKGKSGSAKGGSSLLSLPFEEGVDVVSALDSMLAASTAATAASKVAQSKAGKRSKKAVAGGDSDDSDSSSSEEEETTKRRRKKARSGSKKK